MTISYDKNSHTCHLHHFHGDPVNSISLLSVLKQELRLIYCQNKTGEFLGSRSSCFEIIVKDKLKNDISLSCTSNHLSEIIKQLVQVTRYHDPQVLKIKNICSNRSVNICFPCIGAVEVCRFYENKTVMGRQVISHNEQDNLSILDNYYFGPKVDLQDIDAPMRCNIIDRSPDESRSSAEQYANYQGIEGLIATSEEQPTDSRITKCLKTLVGPLVIIFLMAAYILLLICRYRFITLRNN